MTDKVSAKLSARMVVNRFTRRRAKIGATVDPQLLKAVDDWIGTHPEFDRSKVLDEALRLWYAREQERAMEAQFAEPDGVDAGEWDAWRSARRAAATRLLRGGHSA
jgi:hypothetical protein